MDIRTVGILGSGLMGGGIAQVCCRAGMHTLLVKMTPGDPDAIRQRIARVLDGEVQKKRLAAADRDAALGHLKVSARIEDLADCDLVIESIVEELAIKRETFARLDRIVKAEGIFATNTSTLSVTEISDATKRPTRLIGLHFFNPAPVMKLVEIVPTLRTDPGVIEAAQRFVTALKKTPVVVRDTSGFIVNRLLVPYLVDAIRNLQEGLGSIEEIDTAMRLGAAHPMGPLMLADFIGLDIVSYMASNLAAEFRLSRLVPPPLLRRMVRAGLLGKKSGAGFYDYSSSPPRANDWLVSGRPRTPGGAEV